MQDELNGSDSSNTQFGDLEIPMLNYCNFEVYSLIIPDVPTGRIICISLYPDDPIGRTTESHEEIPSVVSRVISTLINIILSCLCPPREVIPISFNDLLE